MASQGNLIAVALLLAMAVIPRLSVVDAQLPPQMCGTKCAFLFCSGPLLVPFYEVWKPSSKLICRDGARVSHVRASSLATSITRRAAPVPKHIFRVLSFQNGSAIASAWLLPERLDDACIELPIRKWHVGGRSFKGRGRHDCVALRPLVAKIAVELTWKSGDDLDLFVTEPDGTEVSFARPRGNGALLKDENVQTCGQAKQAGTERVVYRAMGVMGGLYRVAVEHTDNCGQGATRWRIRVIAMGKVLRNVSGISNMTEPTIIGESVISFRV